MGDSTSSLRPQEPGQRACHWIQTEAGSQAPGWEKSVPRDLGWDGLILGVDGAGGRELCISFHPHHPLPRYLAKLSSVGSISEEETCEKLKGLIQRQVQMCKRNLEVMDSVRRGAQLAIEECQYQFRNRRWNCSTLDSLPVFGKVVTQGEGGARGGAGGSARGVGPPPGDPGRDGRFLGWGMIHPPVAGLVSHLSSKNSALLQRGHRVPMEA